MSKKRLTDIKSRWPHMRRLKKEGGPQAVANYVAETYLPAVIHKIPAETAPLRSTKVRSPGFRYYLPGEIEDLFPRPP